MLFRKSRIIVYIQKASIELFGPAVDGSERYDFEKDTFKNLEVKNIPALRESIIIFLARTSIRKQEAILVLGKDLLFEQTVPYTTHDQVKEQANKFLNSIKLPPEKVANEMLSNGKEVYLFATNKEIYEVVAEAFASVGWDIKSVIPITLLDIENEEVTTQSVQKLLKDEKLVKVGDLLEKNPVDLTFTPMPQVEKEEESNKEEESTKKEKKKEAETNTQEEDKKEEEVRASRLSKNKGPLLEAGNFLPEKDKRKGYFKFLIIAFLIGILIGIPIFVGYRFYQKGIRLRGDDVKKEEAATLSPTLVPSPTQAPSIAKKDLKIQVQNGTGVPGQAKKVQGALATEGYSNIDAQNADDTNTSTTQLQVSENVSASDRAAIQKALKSILGKVTIDDLPSSSSYDVVIITGQ